MTSATLLHRQNILLENVSWETYQGLLNDWGEHPPGRMTYDRGVLEIMTVSDEHESAKTLIRRLVEAFTEELDIGLVGKGSKTLHVEELERGLEPDECFYIQNESRIRGKKQIDPTRDPPPDLAIEVDITRSSLDRIGIYASLRIPEVWRYDGKTLRIYRLQRKGHYLQAEKSTVLPQLPVADFVRFLRKQGTMSDTRLAQSFRAWVRGRFGR